MTDDELETMFRSSLAGNAGEAVEAGDRAAAAHGGVRRRRRITAGIAGAAAAVILAPAVVVALTLGQGGSNVAAPGVPHSWRVESYNGIELRVPSTWGWGWTILGCQPGPAPYVGRPFPGTLSCAESRAADDSHVWFDSHDPVGSRQGETTVHVHGATQFNITVADPNAIELQRILESIQPVTTDANGCPEKPAKIPWDSQDPNLPNATNASVCLYYARTPGERFTDHSTYLYYSTRVGRMVPNLVRLINAAGLGPRIVPGMGCLVTRGASHVALIVRSADTSTTFGISARGCGGQRIGYDARPDFHVLTKASVALWAVDGVPLYAANGTSPDTIGGYLP